MNFRDNPKLGDGNKLIMLVIVKLALNFRDNPKLGDGNVAV